MYGKYDLQSMHFLFWKILMIVVFLFVGEDALIYFWQRYRILLAERKKYFVEEQQASTVMGAESGLLP